MGVPPPGSSDRRSGVGPELAARDHVLEPRRDVRVIGVEHIEDLMQLSPPSVYLIDHISQSECAHKNGDVIRPSFRHYLPPAPWLLGDLARLVMHDDVDRAR